MMDRIRISPTPSQPSILCKKFNSPELSNLTSDLISHDIWSKVQGLGSPGPSSNVQGPLFKIQDPNILARNLDKTIYKGQGPWVQGSNSSLEVQHSTFEVYHWIFGVQHSTFEVYHWTFEFQHSTSEVYHWMSNVHVLCRANRAPNHKLGKQQWSNYDQCVKDM